ncbi:MAG: efflux RND transporter periplasmic adaptor subunit [Bacteroidales bacterium]|jgi:HlyD family secretion protein|nr:efflux RND transporter periplasmic adaptor subunit [Bacteroidales bacterium]
MNNKLIYWIGGALVVLIVVLAVLKKNGIIGKENSTKVTIEKVTKATIVETVTANGKIQPEKDIMVSPFISGEVIELTALEGDMVQKGQLLAKIDPEQYIAAFERAEAGLNSQKAAEANAKANLAQANAEYLKNKLDYDRNMALWDKKVISDSDMERIKSTFDVSKARVDAAEQTLKSAEFQVKSSAASLREAKENLNRTAVYAPQDGTVSKLNVERGERVQGASQFSAGTELMRIANLNNMEVNVEVSENDIVRVHLGDTTLIEVDAYLNREFKGLVTEIATSANTLGTSADQVTNFDVKIRILSDSYQDLVPKNNPTYSPFRPGMSASVDIQTNTERDVLTVPIAAVTTRADTTGRLQSAREKRKEKKDEEEGKATSKKVVNEYVFLFIDGKAEMTSVKTGIQDNINIQILEGLEDGQEIITGPYTAVSKTLKNHDAVEKTDKKDLFKEKED